MEDGEAPLPQRERVRRGKASREAVVAGEDIGQSGSGDGGGGDGKRVRLLAGTFGSHGMDVFVPSADSKPSCGDDDMAGDAPPDDGLLRGAAIAFAPNVTVVQYECEWLLCVLTAP